MFRLVVLLCLIQYVYGQNCLVTPDANGHVSATDLSAALNATSTPTVIGTASLWYSIYSKAGFYECTALKSIEIPASVTTINERAFSGTRYLKNITFLGHITTIKGHHNNGYYSYGAFYYSGLGANDMSITFMGTVGTIEKYAFYGSGYYANDMSLTFVGDVGTIQEYAFQYSGVTSVTYGGNPPNLGTLVFAYSQYENCRLDGNSPGMNITTGHGTYGGQTSDSFKNCKYLTSVTIENGVTKIWGSAFVNTPLQAVDFSQATSLLTIAPSAFRDTALTSVVIPNSVNTIDYSAFYESELTSVIIPESVNTVGHGAFTVNPITELAILGTPTFTDYSIKTFGKRSGIGAPIEPLQLKRYCFNHNVLPVFIQNQLDVSNAVHDCTFWCETGDMEISTTYRCTKQWSTACNVGFYFAPKPGGMQVSMSDTCTPCPSGTFQSISGSTAIECTPWRTCPAGQIRLDGTNTTDATCQTCTSGYQPNNNSIATTCSDWTVTSCPEGQYLVPGTTTKNGACETCTSGYQSTSGSDATSCLDWTVTECQQGEYLVPGTTTTDGVCEACPAGTYQPENDSNATGCTSWTVTSCLPGEYLVPGTNTTDGVCEACTSGYQPNNSSDATKCTPWTISTCPSGQYLVPGTTTTDGACEPCPAGTYQPENDSNATICDDINDGKQLGDDYGWADVVVHSIRTVTGWSTDKADVKAAWRSKGYCTTAGSDGQVYQKSSDVHCDVNRICFFDGTLDCPIGSVIIDATRCSDKKEHLMSAWNIKENCPS